MNLKLKCHMPNNRQNDTVKKWLTGAHSTLDISHRQKNKKYDTSHLRGPSVFSRKFQTHFYQVKASLMFYQVNDCTFRFIKKCQPNNLLSHN